MNHYYKSFETAFAVFSKSSEREQGSAVAFAQKLRITTFLLFLFSSMSWGQTLSQYTFSTTTTGSLDAMVGATSLSGSSSIVSGYNDDNSTAVINIGFTFNFLGTNYTQFSVNSNGQIRLGSTVVGGTAISSTSSLIPLIVPMSGDNSCGISGDTDPISYLLSGSSPNRILKIQWKNFHVYYSSSTSNLANMQVWLHESGRIDFIYGPMYNYSTSSVSRSIFLASSNTSTTVGSITLSATPTFLVSSTLASNSFPASTNISNLYSANDTSRRTFTWSPPTPCTGTPTPGNTLASINPLAIGTSTVLSLQNSTSGTGVTYQWKSSTDNSTYTNISGATSATYSASPTVSTYYVCDVTCSGVTTTSNSVQVNMVTCYTPTALTSSSVSYQTATISWTAPANGTSPAGYEYEVRTSGAAGSGATGLVTSGSTSAPTVSASLSGLTGGTSYSYYVRSNCGGGDYSGWSSAGTFTTTSCNVPTAITSSVITTSTATISWTAPATGSPVGYEYEVRTTGAAGSGATGLVASGTTTAPTVSASLTGLSAATVYSVYVRSNCYSGFNSSWTTAVTFATLCNAVTSLPFSESFEGITSGIPTCWSLAGTLSSSSTYHFSSTSSGKTGRGLTFNSFNSSNGSTSELITPTLDLTSLSTAELKFWFKNPTGGNFEVLISTNNGASYTSLQSSLTGQTAWLQKTYTITSYISSTVKIKFKGTSNYGSGDAYVYLDEIMVQAIPTCFPVTALTSSAITYQTATIGWTVPSSGTSPAGYDYEIRTSGAAGSGSTGLVTSGSTTTPTVSASLTGLTGGTAYTYYVRSNCGGGDYSSWTSSTFTTSSCSVPTGVTSSSITTTTATISWTAPSGSPSGYEYEVRTSGAAGSGATGLLASGTTTAPTVSASLTGLSASTSYSVYVRTNCYSGFNSSWTSAATLATQCDNITVFPSIFDFATYLPICWQEGDLGDLTAGPSTISSSTSDWVDDGFLNSGSTGSAKMNIDTATGSEWILSPFYSIPASGYRVKYNVGATQFGASTALTTAWESDDFVELLVSTSNSNWSVLKTYNASNVPSYLGQVDTADISAYSGQTVRFAFRAFEGTSNGSADIDFFIDNFTIEQTPNTWTGTASSSWNTAGNWSLNTVPTTGDNVVISSNGTNAPVLDADMTIPVGKSLTISGTGTLTIAPGKTLTIAGTADFGGKAVTFKSDATGSGMFGPLTGTLTGATNVKVERYIPAKRAYRFVSSPVTTTTTIKQNWQENAGTTAGLGTHITGAGGATNGFDATSTDNPSMYTFTSGAWAAVANTNVNVLTAGTPYRLMVRGDRTTDLTTNTPTPTVTTLRATGTLKTGSFLPTINQTADGYSLIGNPYQAPIDIKAILTASSNMSSGVVYYWDPTLNARGGYVTRDLTTDANDVTSSFNQYVQPGQAVFVKRDNTANAASITITESHKSVANGAAGVFRTTTPNDYGLLRLNLQANTNNQWQNIEGTLALFNDNFSWNVTPEDATKMSNLDEEVSFVQNNTSLAIACLSAPNANSELPIQLNNLRQSNYQWQFELANYQGERPYLFDTLNNTYTEITNGATVPFTATTTAANRFKIVFQPSALSTDDFANGMVVYPNPAKAGSSFYVQGITAAEVTVYNVLGQNIPVQVKSQGNTLQVTPTQTLSQGIYLVTVTTEGKTQQVKWIVE